MLDFGEHAIGLRLQLIQLATDFLRDRIRVDRRLLQVVRLQRNTKM